MMKSEFENEYGREVTQEEYTEIEQAYCGFAGDKHTFIKIMNQLYYTHPKLMEDFLQTCYQSNYGYMKATEFNITCNTADFQAKANARYGFAHAAKLETFRLEMLTGYSWACLK